MSATSSASRASRSVFRPETEARPPRARRWASGAALRRPRASTKEIPSHGAVVSGVGRLCRPGDRGCVGAVRRLWLDAHGRPFCSASALGRTAQSRDVLGDARRSPVGGDLDGRLQMYTHIAGRKAEVDQRLQGAEKSVLLRAGGPLVGAEPRSAVGANLMLGASVSEGRALSRWPCEASPPLHRSSRSERWFCRGATQDGGRVVLEPMTTTAVSPR
jgi:hypothetical protein